MPARNVFDGQWWRRRGLEQQHRWYVERNRRAGAPILLLFGAVAGGVFAHSSVGIAGALWTAAIIKAFMVIAWFFWPAEEEEEAQV